MSLATSTRQDPPYVRTQMTPLESLALNGNIEVFAAGVVEHIRSVTCLEGAPGEGAMALVSGVEVGVREAKTGALLIRVIPRSRYMELQYGQAVRLYVTRRGWANHILTWHVLPAIH